MFTKGLSTFYISFLQVNVNVQCENTVLKLIWGKRYNLQFIFHYKITRDTVVWTVVVTQ